MATVGSLVVNIIARTRQFQRGMKTATTLTGRFAAATRAAALSAATLAAIAAPAAFATGLVRAAQSQEQFNKSMTRSLAIMDDVSDAMRGKMSQAAIDLSKTTIFSAREIADSFFFLASAGLNAEQSLEALGTVATFAQAGMFDMARATELLGGSQAALGLKVEDTTQNIRNMARVGDVLVKANVLAQATVEEFSEALTTKSAAAMKFFNIRAEEGVAVLAAFAQQSKKGSDAGTAFDIVIRELTNKAVLFKDEFRKAGIAVFDVNGKLRPLADIIEDVENRLEGMTDAGKTSELMLLGFTAKSASNLRALVGMSEAIRQWTIDLDSAGGTAQRVADDNLTDLEKAWANLTGQIADSGQALSPAIEEFSTIINLFGEGISVVNAFAGAIGDLSLALSGLIPEDFESGDIEFLRGLVEALRFGPIGALAQLTRAPTGAAPFAGGIPLPPGAAAIAKDRATALEKTRILAEEEELARKLGEGVKMVAQHQREWNAFVEDGARLTRSLQTPMERFNSELERFRSLLVRDLITPETFDRASREARRRLEAAQGPATAADIIARRVDVASAARGTQAGFAAAFGRQGTDRLKAIAKNGQQQVVELKGIRAAVEEAQDAEALNITIEKL